MHALGVEPGHIRGDLFGDLPVYADSGLHVESRVEMGIDGVIAGMDELAEAGLSLT